MSLYPRLLTSVTVMQGHVGPYPSLRYALSQVLHQTEEDIDALRPYPPVEIIQEDKNREITRALQDLAGYITYSEVGDTSKILGYMTQIGRWIGERLLPPDCLCCVKGGVPRSVEILTDQQEIPWELTWVNGDFLSKRAVHARYPYVAKARHYATQYQKPPSMAIIVGRTRGLQFAQKEVSVISDLYRDNFGKPPAVYDGEMVDKRLLDAILRGSAINGAAFDIIHFIGHGDAQLDQVWLELSGTPFLDKDIPPSLMGNPLVFWNACFSAQTTLPRYRYQADVMDAFGSRLLAAGASHFVGSLFPVRDHTAYQFALSFYKNVFTGTEIGVALFNSKASLDSVDPLVHTYALFGNPATRMIKHE
jgi:hypothetical protein